MRPAPSSLIAVTAASGVVGLAVVLTLAISRTPLGAPLFFSVLALFTRRLRCPARPRLERDR